VIKKIWTDQITWNACFRISFSNSLRIIQKRRGMKMCDKKELKENQSVLCIHVYFVLTTIAIAIFLCIFNPSYMGRLILPGKTQPMGWIFTIIILILFGFLIGWTLIVPRRKKDKHRIGNLFLFLLFIIIDFILVLMILLSPALIILLTSPVGKLIFGS
jgi:hypothetical protein